MEQSFEVFSFHLETGNKVKKPYLSTEELCDEILPGRSQAAVRNMVMRRMIPFRKVAGRLVFVRAEIETWVESSPGISLEEIQSEGR